LLDISKVDADSKNKHNRTPLLVATKDGHEAIKLLLEIGKADADSKDNNSWTSLLLTAESGHEAVVKLLLKKSAT
jgi:ankyrin repeat protein